VKKLLKSVSIYGSYRKNKTGVPFFGTPCIRFCEILIKSMRILNVEMPGHDWLKTHGQISSTVFETTIQTPL